MDQSNYPTPLKAQARRREEGQIDCKDRLFFNECISTQYKRDSDHLLFKTSIL
jgi:hypothetical protein